MILSAILVLLALFVLFVALRAARSREREKQQVGDLSGRLRPVDLEGFRNLVDPEEEDFLRVNLPPGEFRSIQRERLMAAAAYVSCAFHNAGILLRVGTAAAQSLDPRVAEAGRQLVDRALVLRTQTLMAWARLGFGILLPGMRLSPAAVADLYQQLNLSLRQLGRVQYPARGAGISAAL